MIRELRLTDVPLQLFPGRLAAQDLATTRNEMSGDPHRLSPLQLALWSLAPRKREHHLASVRNGRLEALAALQPRRGPRAWEISHLFAVAGADTALTDLLERVVGFVASQRGERLFLRVPFEGSAQHVAERSGFRKAYTEEVFTLARPMTGDLHGPSLNVRPSLLSDTYAIFRLYNATFPAAARAVIALTLDQWQDGYEHGRGHVREYVWIHDDQVRGWFRIDQHGASVMVDAILHPDESERVPLLASYVAQLAWGHQHSSWIVPDHQPDVARVLVERGWQHSSTYAVMARVVATPVDEPGLAAARA
ncbi:MAG: hypothetical protein O2826_04980 [Chloroflexi bacterium]|nr:hypothetical protein [Chloroflexota bacterium]MDA1173857.1 hypothetical protein [Chloroflexota bacterium]